MFILLFIFWLILNGTITAESVVLGILFSGLIYAFLCRFMGYSVSRDLVAVRLLPYMLQYVFVLLWEIIKANFSVIRAILSSRYVNEPVIVHFRAPLQTQSARVALANAITLTPGTITVSLEGNEYTVHCLDKDFADGIASSVFVKMLVKMERVGGVAPAGGKSKKRGKGAKK